MPAASPDSGPESTRPVPHAANPTATGPDNDAAPLAGTDACDSPRLADGDGHVHSSERSTPLPEPQRDPRVLVDAGELLRALAAPVRISIVLQLRVAERCVHELVEALNVTQPLISQHLRVLKSAGVVYGERHGREVVYRLVDDHLSHIVVDAVAHAEESWTPRGQSVPPAHPDEQTSESA